MDVKPPKNWRRQAVSAPAQPPTEEPKTQPLMDLPPSKVEKSQSVDTDSVEATPVVAGGQKKTRRKWLLIVIAIVSVIVIAVITTLVWYLQAVQPRDSEAILQKVTVSSGMTPRSIGQMLEEKTIIRSSLAFEIYASLNGKSGRLQAGTYKLGGSQSVGEIVDHLSKGLQDSQDVIIVPGMTLKQLADPKVKNSLAAQGYSADEIKSALSSTGYTSPLLKDLPEGQGLEGYLFPETYRVGAGDSLENLLQRAIDELYGRLQAEGLIDKFAAQGLNLHQAITLASIVQQEVSQPADQPQVAQVFLRRLDIGMMLGSDVTALYGAERDGITLSSNAGEAAVTAIGHDSPYNTRLHPGLPPGPIANMNFSALMAVAMPAEGDYLYFVAGDGEDAGKTFFSRTLEEHQAAVAAHCRTLCGN